MENQKTFEEILIEQINALKEFESKDALPVFYCLISKLDEKGLWIYLSEESDGKSWTRNFYKAKIFSNYYEIRRMNKLINPHISVVCIAWANENSEGNRISDTCYKTPEEAEEELKKYLAYRYEAEKSNYDKVRIHLGI